jgi:Ca2+-binding RTX toxin-like protein
VTFTSGSTTSGPVPVVGGQASWTTSYASAGTPAITATYQNSDGNYIGSANSLTQTVLGPGVSVVDQTLYIVCARTSSDAAFITPAGAKADGTTGLRVVSTINGAFAVKTFTQAFTAIVFAGYAANDGLVVVPSVTLPTTVTAGNGKDSFVLGNGTNVVTLGDGNGSVSAGNGKNTVTLGKGNDSVRLGNGDNTVTLGNGDDEVTVGNGNNVVVEGNGDDSVLAGDGNNLIVGGLGQHTLTAGNGNNILIDGAATISSGHSLREVLNLWTANLNNTGRGQIKPLLTVNYNAQYANTLLAGKVTDWFFYTYSKTTSNKKPGDFLNWGGDRAGSRRFHPAPGLLRAPVREGTRRRSVSEYGHNSKTVKETNTC